MTVLFGNDNNMNILSISSSIELKNVTVKSSVVQGDQLFLGANDGKIYIYDIILPSEETKDVLKFREQRKLLDTSIDEIAILPDMNYLITLSNGLIYIYTLQEFRLEETLNHFKKPNLFKIFSNINENINSNNSNIIDESYVEKNSLMEYSDSMSLATLNSTNLFESYQQTVETVQDYRSYIAICCKRKLIVYTFIKDEFSSKLEYSLNDKVKSLEFFSSEKLLVALNNNDLNLIDLYNSDPQNSITKITTLPYIMSSVVNSASTFSYFRNNTSKLFIVRTLPNINIISKESLLLKVNHACEFIHYKKNSSKKNPLHWNKTPEQVLYLFPYLILIYDNNTIEVRKIRTGKIQQTIQISGNIRRIEKHDDCLLIIKDDKIEIWSRSSFIDQLNQAKELSKYEDAISLIEKLQPLVFANEMGNEPEISDKDKKFLILRDFQIKFAKELFEKGEVDRAVDLFISFMAPPDLVIGLFPTIVIDNSTEINLNALLEEDNSSLEETSSILLSPTRGSPRKSPPQHKHSNKKHLNKLVMSLIPYLTDTRRKLNKLLNVESPKFDWKGVTIGKELYLLDSKQEEGSLSSLIELVDTVLFKSYLISSPRLIGPLLRVNNFCNVEIVERNLKLNSMFKELIDFYYTKELHEKALLLLSELGSSSDIFNGPLPTIQYLQKLNNDNIQLIFKYLEWPISVDVEYSKEVFLNDSIESESLNKFKVLNFLEEKVNDDQIIQEYLEHLIYELNDETTKFHNKLIGIYLKHHKMDQLEKLLQFSNSFDSAKVIKMIDDTQDHVFLILKTIILSKLKEHSEVLDILVSQLQKNDAAVSYCLKVYNDEPDTGKNLLTSLLTRFFESENTMDEALKLLSTQGLKLDFNNVLDSLPTSIPISKLNSFLISSLKKFEVNLKQTNFDKSLITLRNVKLKEQNLYLKSNHVIVTEESVCKVCNKRLGYSVLSWFSDNDVVHYGCSKKKSLK